MKRLIWFGVVLAVLVSVMPAAPAKASELPPDYQYHSVIFNVGSGLCLQPWYEAPTNGLTIVQQPCNPNDLYQKWRFHKLSLNWITNPLGTYQIINSGSGQCLDDRDGKTDDGSPVQQWTCNWTSTTMQWKLEDAGGYGSLPWFRNVRSGKCLDVRGGSSAPGAILQIYRCTSTASSPNYAQIFGWTYVTHR
jgi:hypothetical protein